MTFTVTELDRINFGDRVMVIGTFVNDSVSTGGNIVTGLQRVDNCQLTHIGSSVVESAPVVNETYLLAGGDVTIVTVADTSGTYMVIGI